MKHCPPWIANGNATCWSYLMYFFPVGTINSGRKEFLNPYTVSWVVIGCAKILPWWSAAVILKGFIITHTWQKRNASFYVKVYSEWNPQNSMNMKLQEISRVYDLPLLWCTLGWACAWTESASSKSPGGGRATHPLTSRYWAITLAAWGCAYCPVETRLCSDVHPEMDGWMDGNGNPEMDHPEMFIQKWMDGWIAYSSKMFIQCLLNAIWACLWLIHALGGVWPHP